MYVGRIVCVGRSEGRSWVAYRVSSRSFPNRRAEIRGQSVLVQPLNAADLARNPYIAYNCIRVLDDAAVVANGTHADSIVEKIEDGMRPLDAISLCLATLGYERDELDTPRIAGAVRGDIGWLGIARKDKLCVQEFKLEDGWACMVATYEKTGFDAVGLGGKDPGDIARQAFDLSFERPVCAAAAQARSAGPVKGLAVEAKGFDLAIYNPMQRDDMEINGVQIDDTFAEGFPIKAARVQITAVTERWALEAAREATGFGTSVIGCPAEAGIECIVDGSETPDGRPGVNILICNMGYKNLENSLLWRIGQCVLTAPTAAAFSGMPEAEKKFDTGKKLSFFGDGYQKQAELYGRNVWKIPLMSGEFVIEQDFGAVDGVAGGNFLILGQNQMAALTAAEAAVSTIGKLKGSITPFPGGVVSSGSKVGSKYKFLKASTNTAFCTSLREDGVCTLTEDVSAVYEIVINGVNQEAVQVAMKAGINAACRVPGVLRITAANYEGKLGTHQFPLHVILE